ncbi:hypothetical protein [Streptomyces tritici]|uniref:hypothetical protein n=1 Tax=Streptomyces tritici TaxID=2054410 RepID=UPI003AEF6726
MVLNALRAAVETHRLVNLTGPLGVGKTWLASGLTDAARVDVDGPDGLAALGPALKALTSLTSLMEPADSADPADCTEPADCTDGADLNEAEAVPRRTLVIDSVDGALRRDAVLAALQDAGLAAARPGAWQAGAAAQGRGSVVVVSRRPILADARWADSGAVAVTVRPACDGRMALQTEGLDDPEGRAVTARFSGGIPLLAAAVRRALASGVPASSPGAVADAVAGEILDRLGRELPGRRGKHALRLLATVWSGDEQLLPGGPDRYASLAALSIVDRDALGLRIVEPYRTVLELAYRWRKPEAHRTVRTRALGYRLALLDRNRERTRLRGRADREDREERAALAEQGLFLSGDPLLRTELFPAAEPSVRVGTARDDDAGDIGRLMRGWALRSGFDPRRCDRLTERWAADDISAFHIARDRDGRAIGLASLIPIGERTVDGMEPLVQQHSGTLAGGGLFLGAAHCPAPAVRARLLRYVLRQAVDGERLIVSTASPDYQALVRGLGFRVHGGIRDDVYRCGRPPEVYSNDFTASALPWWLGRITDGGRSPGETPARAVPHLSPMELRILLDYASGMTLASAARRAGVSPHTAKDYLKRAKSKYLLAGRPAYTKIDLAQRVREDGLDSL